MARKNDGFIGAAGVEHPSGGMRGSAPGDRVVGEVEQGTQSSNTVPPKYINPENAEMPLCRILRCAVDSLYLSFRGELFSEMDDILDARKKIAQSDDDELQCTAQITIADKLYIVEPHGAGRFRYVISNDRFRIQISRGNKLPLAYVKISSECLTYHPIEKIEQELRIIVNSLGRVKDGAKVSRADLCVDFIPGLPMDDFNVRQWVTRARKKAAYWSVGDRFSGWKIGAGGAIQARTYDKVLEIVEESNKTYMFEVWGALGWQPDDQLWRQEFQIGSTALREMRIEYVPELIDNLGGLWKYLTKDWLRLSMMGSDSNKSRWETHPLWDEIKAAVWTPTLQLPLMRRHISNLPADERIIPGALGYISSFMAKEGITDYGEGLGTFFHHAETLIRQQDKTVAELVEMKAKAKGRKFNTINNRAEIDAEAVKQRAKAYRNAKDGK